MNVILIGFMGTGKSSVGRFLAEKLSYTFIDTDILIEEQEAMTIPQIFERHGEEYFRACEKKIMREACTRSNTVISTGGGVPMYEENRLSMQKNGNTIICLCANIATIMGRIKGRGNRPLLKDDEAKMQTLLNKRMPFYKQCDFMIDTDNLSPLQIVGEITAYLRRRKI